MSDAAKHYPLEFMRREHWLMRKLQLDLPGETTTQSRQDAIRAAIASRKLAETICGRNSAGKPITFRQALEITYGKEPETHADAP